MPHRIARPLAALFVIPILASAQQPERVTLGGREVAIYNLVGTLHVEGGAGDRVTVEIMRAGRDARRLTLDTSAVRGRSALRVRYPEDRIVYSPERWNGRSSFTIDDDGTFGDVGHRGRGGPRRIEVRNDGPGLDAHADLRVTVPRGTSLFLRNGIGETTIEHVDGRLDVSVSAQHVRVAHVRGPLKLDTGSGGVDVSDVTGDLDLDSGPGGAQLDGIRGGHLRMDVGSGSVRGRAIDVSELVADVGSGGVLLAAVKTPRLHLETGSGGSDIELLAPVEDVSVEAGSGGVTLRLPAATSASVDVETGSGSIDTDFEVNVTKMERRVLRGIIGSGHGRIHIEAGSGTVRLLKS